MVKITAALALLCAISAPASALPCVAFEYQEMKEMPINDLVAEACKAQDFNDTNFKLVLSNLEARRGPKPFPEAEADEGQCRSQIERMTRILGSKGITEKLPALCKQKAAGQTIAAPAEAK